ncbi:HEAT repeat domain-containing protein [Dictyobacter formicarum]|uniref:Uncharacterized protein n=1 Tax=Dictyobacter formicarum TaxID=2778368 RepID=A0ABQ3VEH1_9CHLR|nr:HEAT repeat domain-containing protein [Dictyobacter formicarum]GHO84370.1 hypothetical protein KSZ_23760 [Dictyobacter formicarum]
MRSEREYMELAFRADTIGPSGDDELERSFRHWVSRWGRLTVPTLQRIVVQTQDEREKRIALAAIGYTESEEALPLLRFYLHHGSLEERFMSAWSLWDNHRELAFSVLSQLLQVDLLSEQFASLDHFWILDKYGCVVHVFGQWRDPRVVVIVRQALRYACRMYQQSIEQRLPPGDVELFDDYLCLLAYILGKHHALDVLTDLDIDDDMRTKLLVLLILGHLQEQTNASLSNASRDVCWNRTHPTRSSVISALEKHFGLQEAECERYLHLFCLKMRLIPTGPDDERHKLVGEDGDFPF